MKSPDEMAEFYMRLHFTIMEGLHSAPKKKIILEWIHFFVPSNEVTLKKRPFVQARNRQGLRGTTLCFLHSLLST
jgi:hypothetical protein